MGYGNNDPEHTHAVTHLDGVQKYWYDLNGNMTTRIVDGNTYNLAYDAESRLVGVSGATSASFVYDGDGKRVMGIVNGTTTTYIGSYFEWTGAVSTSTRYYYAGTQRIAMRVGNGAQTEGVYWLLSDHLGSTTVTADKDGVRYGELRYKAWGENRYTFGSTPTTYRYTGQREESSFGLYFYNARWYDPYLNRWIQPDSIVPKPNDVINWDRYAYNLNNPIKYHDPSGHIPIDFLLDFAFLVYDVIEIVKNGPTTTNLAAFAADATCAVIPYASGGGFAVRVGGEVAVQAISKVPAGARAFQTGLKFMQAIEGEGSLQSSTDKMKPGTKVNEPPGVSLDDIFIP